MTRRPRRWGRRGVAKTRPGGENPGSRRGREGSPREPDTPAGPTSVSCQRRQRRGGGSWEWSGWSGSSNSSHPVLTGRGSGKRCVGYVRACPGSRLFAASFRPFFAPQRRRFPSRSTRAGGHDTFGKMDPVLTVEAAATAGRHRGRGAPLLLDAYPYPVGSSQTRRSRGARINDSGRAPRPTRPPGRVASPSKGVT